MKRILVFLFSFLPLFSYAEETDSLQLWGWPRDAFTMQPVIDNTLVELMTLDSTVIATAVPHWNEQFRPNSYFTIDVGFRSGVYLIRLTNPEYQTTVKRFKIKARKNNSIFLIGEIKMRRAPISKQLGEAVVTATKIKFYTKGDTLIYNADAFNLAEGSMLDALVEQLPGAELKRDGRIMMNGKAVESVLLNGKDFFKGDNTVLLDNLPAYTVKHVKFYNKKSERSEALKLDMNDARFVMDVELKREYQVGWLTNAEVGGGTHDRWLARLFALRFTPQSRLTFYANANNTHENRKPGRNGDWTPSDIGNGTSTTETAGFDYLITDKHSYWELEGNVNATHTDNDVETKISSERFQSQGSVFNRSHGLAEMKNIKVNTNHKFRFNIGPENDKMSSQLYLKPRFGYSYSKNMGNMLAAEYSANPIGTGDGNNVFHGPKAASAITDLLINQVRTRQRGNSELINGGLDGQLFFELPITGRRMELTVGVQGNKQKDHRFDLYTLNYADASNSDHRHRYFNTPAQSIQSSIGLSWGYSLHSKGFHHLTLHPSVGYSYKHTQEENAIYRLDLLEEMSDEDFGTLPSTREALLASLDQKNSYTTVTDKSEVRATASICYAYDVRERQNNNYARTALWRFTLTPGVTMDTEKLNFGGSETHNSNRTKWLPSLSMRLERNTPGMKHQIWLEGEYTQKLPSQFSLLALHFDNDPLNINEGNANLRKTEAYSTCLYYMSDRWGQDKQRRLNAKITGTFYRNAVATAQIYNAATGVRTFRPENVNGNYNVNVTSSFYTPLDHNRRFSLDLGFYNYFYRNVDLMATDSPLPQRSTVYTNYLTVPLSIEYSYKNLYLGVKGQVAWHSARSKRVNFEEIDGINIDAGIYGSIALPWGIQFSTDFNYYTRRGYDNAVMNTDNYVWNAQLSKSILHGNLTFALVAYDIFGDISRLDYSVNTQGVTETWHNVIPSYGMLRVIYKLNKQPKKKH